MSARHIVDVDFRKWGGRAHYRFNAERIVVGDAGTWLGVRAGTTFTGPWAGRYERSYLIFVPRSEWWVAAWDFSDTLELYVDVAMPAIWLSDGHVQILDLDLDVMRFRDGRVVLADNDEFEEHRVLYSYPDDVVRRAQAMGVQLLEAVRSRREPFRDATDAWRRWSP